MAAPTRRHAWLAWRVLAVLVAAGTIASLWHERRTVKHVVVSRRLELPPSVAQVVARYGAAARDQLEPRCLAAGVPWPPRRVTLLAFKAERQLELWGAGRQGDYHRLATYPVLGASGQTGPKRRYGDRQVPEGCYRLTALNPESAFHLSIRVDYPNQEDRDHAQVPPDQLGGDIYVHGGTSSVGCLAMGDAVIETLFCVVAQADAAERRILIAPCDFRRGVQPDLEPDDPWVRDLYQRLAKALEGFTP